MLNEFASNLHCLQIESYILPILSISGAMQEIPDTSDKFGLDCIVDGSIPAGNLDNNELCVLHIFILVKIVYYFKMWALCTIFRA